jgi:hypothetical protein
MFGSSHEFAIRFLEDHDEQGLKLADICVRPDRIRPLTSFDMLCKFDHHMAGHYLNFELRHVTQSRPLYDYEWWSVSPAGRQLLALDRLWRDNAVLDPNWREIGFKQAGSMSTV